MCGIGGILTRRSELELQPILARMQASLRHRGPDDEGREEIALPHGYRLGMVHTRLSILDLSRAGHQPMHDERSNSWIVFNGEIYNHAQLRAGMKQTQFKSTSDTETILLSWAQRGEGTLESLRGMFALALYDGQRQQFWLVRDRLGIKPLYVAAVGEDTWVFASEVRAILASGLVPRNLNPAAMESYLAFGAVAAPWSMVETVQSVLPGEHWCFDLAAARPAPQKTRYWRPPFGHTDDHLRFEEGVETLRPVLREATALHMVSDVPVGVFLSGGIDSSSLVATLSYQGYRVQTFSVSFSEQAYDESIYGRFVADYFGEPHAELPLHPSEVLEGVEDAMCAYDQPSIDGLNTYFISQAVHRAGIRVAMSGLGGDELFAGYGTFRSAQRLDRPLVRALARCAYPFLKLQRPGAVQTDKLGAIIAGDGSRLAVYTVLRQVMMAARRHDLYAPASANGEYPLPETCVADLQSSAAGLDAVNAYSLHELSLYLANMLLRDTDQMSMVHPVEVRVPLLDHVLVEHVARLAGRLKLNHSQHGPSKPLLVHAVPQPLPPEVWQRQKMGFVFPWELWLRQELKNLVGGILSDNAAVSDAGLDPEAVSRLWSDFLASRPGIRHTDILLLVNLLHWTRQHGLRAA